MKKFWNWMILAVMAAGLFSLPAQAASAPQITALTYGDRAVAIVGSGSDAYAVYRAGSPYGPYSRVGESQGSTYRDSAVSAGSVYYYKIRACRPDGTEWGGFSKPKGICCIQTAAAPAVQNPCYRQDRRIEVQGLMLHSIGCPQERAAAVAAGMNSGAAQVLVHAVIEPSGTVLQLADWELRCWHCGGSGNGTLIGVEMTEPEELRYLSGACFAWRGDAQETVMRNYDTAVRLFGALCLQYGLEPMKDICSHSEGGKAGIASGHADPEHLWLGLGLSLTMDQFRKDVAALLAGCYTPRKAEQTGHIVTVTADRLNIRAGAGTEYTVTGMLCRGEKIAVHAVVQSGQHSWGKLANGCWIALTYTSD